MASEIPNGHVLPGRESPSTQPPEHINGFIDVEILVDIHKYLNESENSDDVALAVWIKENYLQEPLAEIGRPIRNAEGFVNLDKAYRRVRQLTGKAQDKWPFFDTNGKKMSSTAVKNAILGNAAMGTVRSDYKINGEVRDTPTSNGFDVQHEFSSQTPKLRLNFGRNDASGQHILKQKSPQPADPPLADQQESERKAHRQDRSPLSNNGSISETSFQNTLAVNNTENGTTSTVDPLRDAGAGKVRGPHGRFVNKSKPWPAAKKGPNIKYVKKSRSRAALEGESDEEGSSSDDEGVAPPKTSHDLVSGSGPGSDGNGEAAHSSSEPRTERQSTGTTNNDFPVASILAAEAEAVPSNLDRLPPGFVGKKRKSETNIQRGGAKRARGSRGGVLGRPRKSETLAEHSQLKPEESMELDQTSQPSQPVSPAQNPARRSSRKSAASAVDASTPWDLADDVLLNGTERPEQANNATETKANGVGITSNGHHRTTETLTNTDQKTRDAVDKTMNGAPLTVPANPSASQIPKTKKAPASTKQKKRVSFSPEIQADKVEFFARILTSAGTQEVPLSEEDLTSEVSLVKRYAAWQNSGNANVTFDVFKNIVKFAR